MLDVTSLLNSIAGQFPDYEKVEERIVRFQRRQKGAPFAVCFVDLTEQLPTTEENLAIYQDRIIGRYYFEGEKSLQWNNYLYFLVSPENLATPDRRKAKLLIEGDRRYARKFVIPPKELDAVLHPTVFAHKGTTQSESILSIWTEQLEAAGIYDAVMSDKNLPDRLRLIEHSSMPSRGTRAPWPKEELGAASFIRSLELANYRPFPRQRRFDFGTVNLLVGANGSGKTSLLEAIELFYCGRNKRNPDGRQAYTLSAHLGDGSTEEATNAREWQTFRDRNLEWYGVAEVKTTNLYQSFARFNFLDTDAAVSLSETTETLSEDLSKLLVGPEAAKTWREIERVSNAVSIQLRSLEPRKAQIEEELDRVTEQLTAATKNGPESDALKAQLAMMLRRLDWSIDQQEQVYSKLVQELAELASVVQQATDLVWTESPVTRAGIATYLRNIKAMIGVVEPLVAQLEQWRTVEAQFAGEIARLDEAARFAGDAKLLHKAGVRERSSETSSLQATKHVEAARLAGLPADVLNRLPSTYLDLTLTAGRELAVATRSAATVALEKSKEELSTFNRLRDQAVSLAQELRAIASRILGDSPTPDQCPLCHTTFEPGELGRRMRTGVDDDLEATGQALHKRVYEQEAILRELVAVEAAIAWLGRFCDAVSLPGGITIRGGLAEVETAQKRLATTSERLNTLRQETAFLESQGISKDRLDVAIRRLDALGYPLTEGSETALDDLLSTLTDAASRKKKKLQEARNEAEGLEQGLRTTLGTSQAGTEHLKQPLSQARERLKVTEAVQTKLDLFATSFPWPSEAPLAELLVEVESTRTVAAKLQAALEQERQRVNAFSELTKRKQHLEAERDKLRLPIERLTAAQSTLTVLQAEHSLTDGVTTALKQNKAAIEAIFTRIHAPAEFQGLGSSWSTLIRKSDGQEARLTEISTGQRAAFALSLFLAQNAQLAAAAPPVVLIDDPIAHVDDLNALSFLDYLRELVLTGERQIFFATANTKLADLFQRKFEFLGKEEFRRFNLCRETPLK
ncbi:MAG TPA: AAA family ATPase [Symbiobacteriaceae bacterium]|nr:AAA family ATPase [Symbiobacteriaceae bacterium]